MNFLKNDNKQLDKYVIEEDKQNKYIEYILYIKSFIKKYIELNDYVNKYFNSIQLILELDIDDSEKIILLKKILNRLSNKQNKIFNLYGGNSVEKNFDQVLKELEAFNSLKIENAEYLDKKMEELLKKIKNIKIENLLKIIDNLNNLIEKTTINEESVNYQQILKNLKKQLEMFNSSNDKERNTILTLYQLEKEISEIQRQMNKQSIPETTIPSTKTETLTTGTTIPLTTGTTIPLTTGTNLVKDANSPKEITLSTGTNLVKKPLGGGSYNNNNNNNIFFIINIQKGGEVSYKDIDLEQMASTLNALKEIGIQDDSDSYQLKPFQKITSVSSDDYVEFLNILFLLNFLKNLIDEYNKLLTIRFDKFDMIKIWKSFFRNKQNSKYYYKFLEKKLLLQKSLVSDFLKTLEKINFFDINITEILKKDFSEDLLTTIIFMIILMFIIKSIFIAINMFKLNSIFDISTLKSMREKFDNIPRSIYYTSTFNSELTKFQDEMKIADNEAFKFITDITLSIDTNLEITDTELNKFTIYFNTFLTLLFSQKDLNKMSELLSQSINNKLLESLNMLSQLKIKLANKIGKQNKSSKPIKYNDKITPDDFLRMFNIDLGGGTQAVLLRSRPRLDTILDELDKIDQTLNTKDKILQGLFNYVDENINEKYDNDILLNVLLRIQQYTKNLQINMDKANIVVTIAKVFGGKINNKCSLEFDYDPTTTVLRLYPKSSIDCLNIVETTSLVNSAYFGSNNSIESLAKDTLLNSPSPNNDKPLKLTSNNIVVVGPSGAGKTVLLTGDPNLDQQNQHGIIHEMLSEGKTSCDLFVGFLYGCAIDTKSKLDEILLCLKQTSDKNNVDIKKVFYQNQNPSSQDMKFREFYKTIMSEKLYSVDYLVSIRSSVKFGDNFPDLKPEPNDTGFLLQDILEDDEYWHIGIPTADLNNLFEAITKKCKEEYLIIGTPNNNASSRGLTMYIIRQIDDNGNVSFSIYYDIPGFENKETIDQFFGKFNKQRIVNAIQKLQEYGINDQVVIDKEKFNSLRQLDDNEQIRTKLTSQGGGRKINILEETYLEAITKKTTLELEKVDQSLKNITRQTYFINHVNAEFILFMLIIKEILMSQGIDGIDRIFSESETNDFSKVFTLISDINGTDPNIPKLFMQKISFINILQSPHILLLIFFVLSFQNRETHKSAERLFYSDIDKTKIKITSEQLQEITDDNLDPVVKYKIPLSKFKLLSRTQLERCKNSLISGKANKSTKSQFKYVYTVVVGDQNDIVFKADDLIKFDEEIMKISVKSYQTIIKKQNKTPNEESFIKLHEAKILLQKLDKSDANFQLKINEIKKLGVSFYNYKTQIDIQDNKVDNALKKIDPLFIDARINEKTLSELIKELKLSDSTILSDRRLLYIPKIISDSDSIVSTEATEAKDLFSFIHYLCDELNIIRMEYENGKIMCKLKSGDKIDIEELYTIKEQLESLKLPKQIDKYDNHIEQCYRRIKEGECTPTNVRVILALTPDPKKSELNTLFMNFGKTLNDINKINKIN